MREDFSRNNHDLQPIPVTSGYKSREQVYKRITADPPPAKSEVLYQEKPSGEEHRQERDDEGPQYYRRRKSQNGEMFTQISRSVDMDLPMQLPKQTIVLDEEPQLKIPSSRKTLDSSSFLFDHEDLPRKTDVSLGPIMIPEPPKLSRYSQMYRSHDF